MRVNITYSVNLDSVPAEVDKLMDEAEVMLINTLALFEIDSAQPTLELISDINGIREKLLEIDSRLGDCSNILSGYLDVKTKLVNTPQQHPTEGLEESTNE